MDVIDFLIALVALPFFVVAVAALTVFAYFSAFVCVMWLIWLGGKFEKKDEQLLQCGIDPRCHSAFFIDSTGQAWVGRVKLKNW